MKTRESMRRPTTFGRLAQFHVGRAVALREKGLHREAVADFVRALLVSSRDCAFFQESFPLPAFFACPVDELPTWVQLALASLEARARGDSRSERLLLEAALRFAPEEKTLGLALLLEDGPSHARAA